jgi:hypothetical protein
LLTAWKFNLERLKGEVERALNSVYEGLELFGPDQDWASEKAFLKPKPKSQPKPKFKPKPVKFRSFRLLRKPKPTSTRLDLARILGLFAILRTSSTLSGSDEGCGAPSLPNCSNASPEVVPSLVASPEVVLLPASESEAVRQVGFGTACPGEAGGSFFLPGPEVSSATAKISPEVAQILPKQCLAIRDYLLEPVQSSPEAMNSPQASLVEQPPASVLVEHHGVQVEGESGVQHVEESKIVQCAMEIGPLLGISCGGDEKQLLGLLCDLDKVHCQEISATRSNHGAKGSRELKNLDCSNIFEGSSRGKGKRACLVVFRVVLLGFFL